MEKLQNKNNIILKLIIGIFSVLIVIAAYSFINYKIELKKTINQISDELNGNNNEIIYCVEKSNNFKTEYGYIETLHHFTRMGLSAYALENISQETFEKLSATTTAEDIEVSIYHLDLDRKVTASLAKNKLSLSDEELDELIEEGRYANSDFLFFAVKNDSHYLILSKERVKSDSRKINLVFPSNIPFYIKNVETGEIVETNIPELSTSTDIFEKKPVNLNYKILGQNKEITELTVNGKKSICVINSFEVDGEKYEVGSLYDIKEFKTLVWYVPFMTCFLLCVFAVMVFYAVFRLRKEVHGKNISLRKLKIGNIWTSDKVLIKNLSITIITIGLIIVFYTIYFFASTRVLQYYSISDKALTNILTAADTYKKNSNLIYSESYSAGKNLAEDVSEALLYDYVASKEEVIERLAKIIDADEITVYDKNGVIEYSTTKYKGYYLPKDEKNPRSRLWSILEGGTTDMCIVSDNSSVVDFAVRRMDDVGIVVLSFDLIEVESLIKKLSYSELIKFHDYDNIEQMYLQRSEPGKLYIVKDGSSVEIAVTNDIPINADGESLFSVRKIQVQKYLINSLGSEDAVTMLGYSTSGIKTDSLQFLFRTIVAHVLIGMIAFSLTGQSGSADIEKKETVKETDDFLKAEAKKIQIQIFPVSAIMAIILSVGAYFYFGDVSSVVSAVENMDKGFNILSVTSIMFHLGFTVGEISILSFLSQFLSKMSNAKTATLVSLLCSVLKTVLIVIFSVFSLKQLGVNTTAITAGLGLSGLAVGIGSKEIINDLVAGIFIIFEGQIQVGDYVSVDGFYGEIICLGVRTTKIKRFNKELIINNSNLKNVINLSRGTSFAVISFVFDFDTDLVKLSRIVAQSNERINQAADGLILGDLVDLGVENVTDIGIEYIFGATVAIEAQRIKVQHKSRAEMIRIFAENGIKIAKSNRITVKKIQTDY